MKKIGMIGGLSWESSQVYYQILNEKVNEALGGFHSALCILESVNFGEIEKLQSKDDWETMDLHMAEAAKNLENAKAELIILCTNTMHLCSDAIINNVDIPFLHIARETAKRIKASGLCKVLLLGTKFTMERDFFKDILQNEFNIGVVVPNGEDQNLIHNVIYQELVHGNIKPRSKANYQRIISKMIKEGAEGVILGCTEIPLLIKASDVTIPIFDTTRIHAEAAVQFALK
jgi:aspartate racemase